MENFLVGISLNRMKRSLEAQRTLETNSFIVHLNENINTVGSHADEYVGHSDMVGVFSLPAVHPEVTKDGLLNMVYSFTLCLSQSFTWFAY
jgi:hypothetical protein